jgi:hypothetical protein
LENKGTSKNYLIGYSLVGTIYKIKPLFLIAKIRKKAVFRGAHNFSGRAIMYCDILQNDVGRKV